MCLTAPIPLTPRAITIGTMPFTWHGIEISRTEDSVQAYLDEWVYGVPDRAAYWEKLGPEVHQRLHPVNAILNTIESTVIIKQGD